MKLKEQLPELNRVGGLSKQKKVTRHVPAQKPMMSTDAMNNICKPGAQPLERLFEISRKPGVSITAILNVDYKPPGH